VVKFQEYLAVRLARGVTRCRNLGRALKSALSCGTRTPGWRYSIGSTRLPVLSLPKTDMVLDFFLVGK
jgi:hypothetical protein